MFRVRRTPSAAPPQAIIVRIQVSGIPFREVGDGKGGTRADAVEKRSGVVERVRPLPIRQSCCPQDWGARAPEDQ
jgi:hypothetical protein